MDSSNPETVHITSLIRASLPGLATQLRTWAEARLIEPHAVELYTDLDTGAKRHFWLVTNDIGKEDGSYRVVFDSTAAAFGLAMFIADGRPCFMGIYGSFADCIENM